MIMLFLGACSKPIPPIASLVDGSVRGEWTTDRAYTNDFFGLTISIPERWDLRKGDQRNLDFMLESIGLLSGSNQAVEDALRQKLVKIHVPMRALAHPDMGPGKNPSVLVMIENVAEDPTIKTGGDYLTKMEGVMNSSPQLPKFDGPPTETTINGRDFWTRTSALSVNGGEGVLFSGAGGYTIHQQGYSTVKEHYALTILCTWFSSSDNPTDEVIKKHVVAKGNPAEQVGASDGDKPPN